MQGYSDFGIEARMIMLQKGIKMIDVAKELEVSVTYISEIFKGTRNGEKQKPKIAEMLGMKIKITHES